jgi:hypothetical protein
MIKTLRPQPHHIVIGTAYLSGFLLLMAIIFAMALGNHRRTLERQNRELEALEKRQDEINKRYQYSFEMLNGRIEALEKGKRNGREKR